MIFKIIIKIKNTHIIIFKFISILLEKLNFYHKFTIKIVLKNEYNYKYYFIRLELIYKIRF